MTRHRERTDRGTLDTLGRMKVYGVPQGSILYCDSPWKQSTDDELHKASKKKSHSGRLYLSGGPFDSLKVSFERSNTSCNVTSGGSNPAYSYNGNVCNAYFGNYPTLGAYITDTTDLVGIGTRGIAKFKPGNPVASAGQFIVELREGLPRIPGVKLVNSGARLLEILKYVTSAKSLGKEYLNIEFGWKPMLQDLKEFIQFQDNLHKALTQLKRDNGKVVRRHGSISHSETSSVTSLDGTNYLYPGFVTGLYWSGAPADFKGSLYTRTRSRYWFSGAFRYWIPDIMKGPTPSLRTVMKLLDIYPSPHLLWEVLPWSWLFDWISSVGDVLDNISGNAAENLVLLYGYAMGHKEVVSIASCQSHLKNGSWIYASVTRRQSHKRRIVAYPFGFSAGLPVFTDRQTAILVALGLSKRRT